jgi:Signal transduction histidine kinase involved in nitrogen fixation and metabolism regulation
MLADSRIDLRQLRQRWHQSPGPRLLEGTRAVEAGHLDQSIDVTTTDEIGQLTAAFNRSAASASAAPGDCPSSFADFAPIGVENAQINATGQSNPPVAIPIQLMALMAAACG